MSHVQNLLPYWTIHIQIRANFFNKKPITHNFIFVKLAPGLSLQVDLKGSTEYREMKD